MSRLSANESAASFDASAAKQSTDSDCQPLVTLFAAPKAFAGHTGVIQRNAILSWCCLQPQVEVFLFGDDAGIEEISREQSVRHFPDVSRNESGTPLLDGIFQQAIDAASAPIMMYTNSDMIFDQSLPRTIHQIKKLNLDFFLGIGQRTDFDQTELIDFDEPGWERQLGERLKRHGQLASILCKDYFIFPRTGYRDIPAFSIGRGNWDSWMVSRAVKNQAPVIDLTERLRAVHQNHDHTHVGGRMRAYVTGPEARRNLKLAGGTHYVKGSVATHRLTADGEFRRQGRFPLWGFLGDLPRILKLCWDLLRR